MKKILLAILLLPAVLITGCFSGGPTLDGKVEGNKYISSDFAITLPQDWEVVEEFDKTYPDNTVVAVRNHVKNSDFVANVNVTYSEIDAEIDVRRFAKQMLETHSTTLINFREVGISDFPILVGGNQANSVLNVFEGKQGPDAPMLRFLQTYGYKGSSVYIVTGTYSINEEMFAREKVENTLRSFEIR